MQFNKVAPRVMHLDVNSCFATIEQQANPFLRGKPVAVAAYPSANGCILAASYEAKGKGVKTGMRVKDGKALAPGLIVLGPDPWKYRNIHLKLRKLLSKYTPLVFPKSIDEFVLHFEDSLHIHKEEMVTLGAKIKDEIRETIGEAISVSVGIGPNRFLAKLAAGIEKPDGLIQIDFTNFEQMYRSLDVKELCGIKQANANRLSRVDIKNVYEFYSAPLWKLRVAFESINSYYWYLRLRGYEIDNVEYSRRSYGNSYSLPKPFTTKSEISPIIAKLVTKTSGRLRRANLVAQGVHLALQYKDGDYWHKGRLTSQNLFATEDIYREIMWLFDIAGYSKTLRHVAISVFDLNKKPAIQLELFENTLEKIQLMKAIDKVNTRWGDYIIYPARMAQTEGYIPDRIAFGGVKELEEIVL